MDPWCSPIVMGKSCDPTLCPHTSREPPTHILDSSKVGSLNPFLVESFPQNLSRHSIYVFSKLMKTKWKSYPSDITPLHFAVSRLLQW